MDINPPSGVLPIKAYTERLRPRGGGDTFFRLKIVIFPGSEVCSQNQVILSLDNVSVAFQQQQQQRQHFISFHNYY